MSFIVTSLNVSNDIYRVDITLEICADTIAEIGSTEEFRNRIERFLNEGIETRTIETHEKESNIEIQELTKIENYKLELFKKYMNDHLNVTSSNDCLFKEIKRLLKTSVEDLLK